ncbi:MAG TPA: hypothetical protein VFJ90_04335 [Candidatus Didemnitutus sp.]|nr:hypothetical protein [Candidatus Didemnitutus sp.]
MNDYVPYHLRSWFDLFDLLEGIANQGIKAAGKAYRLRTRARRGNALHPGPDTPLWNELAKQVHLQLRRYGDKANLGREIGLPRQRIHQLIVARTACADAERTLLLLIWLQARLRYPKSRL